MIPNTHAGLAMQNWHASLSSCDAPLLGGLDSIALSPEGRKCDSPKAIRGIVSFNKFDSVGRKPLRSSQLRDHSSGYLGAPRVTHHDGRADRQLAR